MILRKIEKRDMRQAAGLVGLNYSKKYEKIAIKELGDTFKKISLKPNYIVAEEEGKIIGVAGYKQSWINYHIYKIFWVNVHPKYQRQGIGKIMIQKIIEILKSKKGDNKANLVLLTAKSPNYYEKFGFKKLNEFRKKDYLMGLNIK